MKVVTIIQARTTSSRLPNKVLMDIHGRSLLERVVDQSKKITNSDELWVATTTHPNDDVVEMICNQLGVSSYRGDVDDVRSRFYNIARERKADIVVRITADNPLTEPAYAIELIETLKGDPDLDYARMAKEDILDGTGSEAFTYKALEKSVRSCDGKADIEHVTTSIISDMEIADITPSSTDLVAKKPYFVGVDTFEDYKKSWRLFMTFGNQNTLKQIIKKLDSDGKIF